MSATPGISFPDPKKYGFAGRMASLFIDSKLTPIIVAASLLLGLFAILVLPREEEPQIKVPMIDVMVAMPGAGIVVRNSIILVDFIELRLSHGLSLRDACVESGAVRFRPMMLTALAVIVGGLVILADPIFQGLAISLLFGAIASLLISPLAVPLIYYMTHAGRGEKPARSTLSFNR
jgi:multidrug efflux pump subunit AcrB